MSKILTYQTAACDGILAGSIAFVILFFTCLATSRILRSTYSSVLTTSTSDRYSRDEVRASNYYYQALHLGIPASGTYRFQNDSAGPMYGYLYQDTFNPLYPSRNLLVENDHECGKDGLWLNSSLLSNASYILVVTTRFPDHTGAFIIQAFGPTEITFKLIRE